MKEEDEEKYYNEEFYKNISERNKRMQELLEREAMIKKEKSRLVAYTPWYRKPQNLIGIFGILFPIIVSFLISTYQKENRELTVFCDDAEQLITDSEHIKTNVFIRHDSSEINNISKLRFTIKNTGTKEISKTDFTDGPIQLKLKNKNDGKSVKILDVVNSKNADQQKSELNVTQDEGRVSYLPSLMNVNDEVCIDIYLLNTPKVKVDVIGKLSGGEILGPINSEAEEITYGYKSFVLSIVSFFGYKWIAVAFVIILFILTALSSFFQYIMLIEDELDPKVLGFFMATSTAFISVLSIVLVVSILMY